MTLWVITVRDGWGRGPSCLEDPGLLGLDQVVGAEMPTAACPAFPGLCFEGSVSLGRHYKGPRGCTWDSLAFGVLSGSWCLLRCLTWSWGLQRALHMDACIFVAPELWRDWTSLGLHFSVSEMG